MKITNLSLDIFHAHLAATEWLKTQMMQSINLWNITMVSNHLVSFSSSLLMLEYSTYFVIDINDEINQVDDEVENIFYELISAPMQITPFSPSTAVRSIVTNCLQEVRSISPVISNWVRLVRRHGEEITTDNLLQNLKDKKIAKDAHLKAVRSALKKNSSKLFLFV